MEDVDDCFGSYSGEFHCSTVVVTVPFGRFVDI